MIRLLWTFALVLILQGTGLAHELRPGFLNIQQIDTESYDVRFKVPARGDMRLALYVHLPENALTLKPRASSAPKMPFWSTVSSVVPAVWSGGGSLSMDLPVRSPMSSSEWSCRTGPFRHRG